MVLEESICWIPVGPPEQLKADISPTGGKIYYFPAAVGVGVANSFSSFQIAEEPRFS